MEGIIINESPHDKSRRDGISYQRFNDDEHPAGANRYNIAISYGEKGDGTEIKTGSKPPKKILRHEFTGIHNDMVALDFKKQEQKAESKHDDSIRKAKENKIFKGNFFIFKSGGKKKNPKGHDDAENHTEKKEIPQAVPPHFTLSVNSTHRRLFVCPVAKIT